MNCLFVGNGLTKTIEGTDSWDTLLENVAKDIGVKRIENIPFTLEFEHLVNQKMIANPSKGDAAYQEVKNKIAEGLEAINLPSDAVHYQIPDLNPDCIITTNYDYLIEDAFGISRNEEYKSNQKYILNYTHTKSFPVQFYHAHGVTSSPKSICLGFEHYAGLVQHIREETNKKTKDPDGKPKIKILQLLNGDIKESKTWPELFYKANISFIGYGLDHCEIDMWSILTHRAYLYYANIEDAQKLIKNRIVYYSIAEDIPYKEEKDKEKEDKRITNEAARNKLLDLLKSMHVETEEVKLSAYGGIYKEAYKGILGKIKEDWNPSITSTDDSSNIDEEEFMKVFDRN